MGGVATPNGRLPPTLAPMLAAAVPPPRDLSGWLLEPKWDGVRTMVTVHAGQLQLTSRNGNDVTSHYPELLAGAAALAPRSAVLDGEVVAFDDAGRTSFQRLQRRMHVREPSPALLRAVPVALMVFDVVWLDGELLASRPQHERRELLEGLALDGPAWHTSPLLPLAPVDELLRACQEVGMEGYVAKRADAVYLPGRRSSSWIKVKCIRRREFVVGGWAPGRGGRQGFIGSLAVGCYGLDPATGSGTGRLHYVGQVGSGLSEATIAQLAAVFARSTVDHSPFAEELVGDLTFVHPALVAEVAYTEVTEGGTLRQPSLQGFRTDLDPLQVVADEELQAAFGQRPSRLKIRPLR